MKKANAMETASTPVPRITTGLVRIGPGRSARATFTQYVISCSIAGATTYHHPAGTFEFVAGDVLLVQPHTPHFWQRPSDATVQDWQVVYLLFTPRIHWQPWLQFPPIDGAPQYFRITLRDPAIRRRVIRSLIKAHHFAQSTQPLREDLALASLEQALLWCQSELTRQRSPLDERVTKAVDYLTTHLTEPVRLHELARACHTSRSHLAYLFQQQMGVPPMTFHEQQRMERAMQLLRLTAEPVSQIAMDMGFDDPKHFSKRFRLHAGVSPRTYREQARI